MRLHAAVLLATVALAAAGCASDTPPPTPVATAPMPAPAPAPVMAKRCMAPRALSKSGFNVRMTASNDGTCAAEASFGAAGKNKTDRTVFTSGSVTTEPKHGTAKLRFEPTDSFIDYTPTPGFVGKDSFVVSLLPGTRPWNVAVTVVKP